ncbi:MULTISPECIES: TetR/AcrR family transcriptional regulator [Nocardia]|uniref:TetR/AcrR family transcriptional regulator n=1 Tax=Nocardia TaxID=1817 RepID=UPI0019165D6F|nr:MULTISPECIES: TetR/AcrR family transcriptional regulator [Nocardia]UAK30786.1 TetR/AcrR family transcriptional regulator [Nocardia asteroides]
MSAAPADAPITPVRNGVFFTLPEALPRGRHKLAREQVLAAQRERLLAAATELLAARGYSGFGPTDIAKRAGVSLAAFYDAFANKDECVFAGYDRFIQVLLTQLITAEIKGRDRRSVVGAALSRYLGTLQDDVVVARAYQVEIDALGPAVRRRRRQSLRRFAEHIRGLVQGASSDRQPPLSVTAYMGVVYAVRQLTADALDESEEPDLTALSADLEPWLIDLFRER